MSAGHTQSAAEPARLDRRAAFEATGERLRAELERTRRATLALIAPLSERELEAQHDPLMSPLVWDLGHIACFEECWLLDALEGTASDRASVALDPTFDPFRHGRRSRGELALPDRRGALQRLAEVRARALDRLERVDLAAGADGPERDPLLADGFVYRMVIQHECQHQETMLQAIQLMRSDRPYDLPPQASAPPSPAGPVELELDDEQRIAIPGGSFLMGTDDRARAYDNERPAHPVELGPFAIDRYPASNRRYLEFVEQGGYDRRELWTEAGWAWRESSGVRAPLGWGQAQGAWTVLRLGRRIPLDPREPVQHVCFHEAQAFARFAGGRLPSEAEWEKAARFDPRDGSCSAQPWGAEDGENAHTDTRRAPLPMNGGLVHPGPRPLGSYPAGASPCGVEQLLGDVYEWTASTLSGYPGFDAFPYREYSEVFFDGTWQVLRGSSWAADLPLARATYRNWDRPERRQIFAGLRLAWGQD